MRPCRPRSVALLAVLAALAFAPPAAASYNAGIAALQVALHTRGLYSGTIDGVKGAGTTNAVKRFQRQAGLPVDGVAGATTRKALGRFGRHLLGSRPLRRGQSGWDVAALQFLLAWHGFPSASIDGGLGSHTDRAVRRFQRWAGVTPDGVAGPSTIAALRKAPAACPLPLAWPLKGPIGSPFGPRGNRFHAGIDIVAPQGTPIAAAAPGRVVYAAFAGGGWGNLVVVLHSGGVRSLYAHLSKIDAHRGANVATGTRLGLVGATGDATGPHLHFEVRLRGAAVDPRSALP
jgi:peptidoglycan hydrolase-like protein with peptidoglycan-binding domain